MLKEGDIVTTYPFNLQDNVSITGVIVSFKRYRGKLDSCRLKVISSKSYFIISRHIEDVKKIGEMSIEQLLTHEASLLRELGRKLLLKKESCEVDSKG